LLSNLLATPILLTSRAQALVMGVVVMAAGGLRHESIDRVSYHRFIEQIAKCKKT